jgi:hypothetical protein
MDNDGRFLYIKQGKSVWNPGWKPVRAKLDAFECRHGLGYTRIKGRKDGIEVEQLMFVPPNENLEVWKVSVRNKTKKPQKLTLFSFVEFCFFEALNDMTNYQRTYSIGEVEIEGSADLPQDRVPRAPQPLHAIRMHAANRRATTPRGTPLSASTTACTIPRPSWPANARTATPTAGTPSGRTR